MYPIHSGLEHSSAWFSFMLSTVGKVLLTAKALD
jgi:hypothetical protein